MVSKTAIATDSAHTPDEWPDCSLGDLFTFKNGLNKEKQYFGIGTPIVNYMDVYSSPHIRANVIRGLVTVNAAERENFSARKGDVFFTRTSETVDEIGMASVALDELENAVFSGFVLRARPTSRALDSLFAGYALRSESIRRQIGATASYTTRALTNGRLLSAVRLNVPPLHEQQAIAAALSNADALIEALESLIAKKRAIKQGAMQELLSGRRRLVGFEGAWEEKSFGEIASIDPENLSSQTIPSFSFNYIALEDVAEGSLCGFSERAFRSAPSRARRKLQCGDVLVATVRPNLKSHLYFTIAEGEWVCSTGFSVLRCHREIAFPGYIFAHLFGDVIARQIDMLISGSNYPAINSRDVAALRISCPPLEEQIAISEVLSEMDSELKALTQHLAKTRQIKQGMMQELLTGRVRLA